MTKEEFEKVGGFGTKLYICGRKQISVCTKYNDRVTWYDSEEFYHNTPYEELETEPSEDEKTADRLARKYIKSVYRSKPEASAEYMKMYEAYKEGK